MTMYRIRDAEGAVIYEYQYDSQLVFEAWPTPPYTQEVVTPEEEANPPYSGSWLITKLAFRSRFTMAEKVGIEMAALDNPLETLQKRAQSAALRAYLGDLTVATFIDLKRADTQAGVQSLEAAGLLTAGRAAAILDTPPVDAELHR